MPVSYELNEEHADILRTIFKLPAGEPLPDVVVRSYWRTKIIADRINTGLSASDFISIAVRSQYPIPGSDEENALQWFREGFLKVGDQIHAMWKKKEVIGTFKGFSSADKPLVEFDDGTTEDRELPLDAIRLIREAHCDSESTRPTVP